MDEEGVHDSFSRLIAEQRDHGGASDAVELQQLQRQLHEEDPCESRARRERTKKSRAYTHQAKGDVFK